ncbi:MAG: DUF4831 family protein [Prevotellaceae bacterium]|jgi:hypothetical protein|nr:DUF4831 family protein [Prevotellaceae bacterium]
MQRIVLLMLLLCPAGVVAQTEVMVGVTRGKEYGVTYVLPKTEIRLTVRATKHSYIPGEFAKYAERYLRLEDVSSEPENYWTLDEVQTTMLGVPDRERVYFVKLKDKTVAPLMELTADGIVRSINRPLETASSKEPAVLPPAATVPPADVDPRGFLTEEILLANSTAKMADLIAKEIYAIRESKNALTRGEADNLPKDGTQLKLMLDNLTVQERALTEMFAGKRSTEEKVYTFEITPREVDRLVAFRFSKKLGVVEADDLSGEPVLITITDLKSLTIPPEVPVDPKKALDGIAYNVPGRARISVAYRGEEIYKAEVPVTQFGLVEYLAPVLFNKNSTTQVLFDTQTGGLLKVDRSAQ